MSASTMPDLQPARPQREREVDRQRRLADAALARRDRDHARALLDGDLTLAVGPAALQLRAQRGALLLVHVREADRDGLDARHGADVHPDLRLEVRLERAARDREPDRDVHVAAVDVDGVDHSELHDVAPDLGVDDERERALERIGGRAAHDGMLARIRLSARRGADAEQSGDPRDRFVVARGDDARARHEIERGVAERAAASPAARRHCRPRAPRAARRRCRSSARRSGAGSRPRRRARRRGGTARARASRARARARPRREARRRPARGAPGASPRARRAAGGRADATPRAARRRRSRRRPRARDPLLAVPEVVDVAECDVGHRRAVGDRDRERSTAAGRAWR